MSYQYWVVRFVPDVARGEFTNIGIVCGRDGGDWAVDFDLKAARSHGSLAGDLRELGRWVAWFRGALSDDGSMTSRGGLEHLRSRQANSVQLSAPSPVDVDTAQQGVELLFPHLVERAVTRHHHGLTRRRLRADVRDLLDHRLNFVVGQDLFVNPTFEIGKQRGTFDFLLSRTAHPAAANVWAFNVATLDVLERDIQSWNYLVGRLREDGANLALGRAADSSRVALAPDASIEVVYDPPSSDGEARRTEVFEAALEAWELSAVSTRTLEAFRSGILMA